MREQEFYVKQSEGMSTFIRVIGMLVAFFFSLAATIGAMITMYSSVATRGREIGTLRALGFKRWEILASFLFESVVLAIVGGTIGALLSLLLGLVRFPLVNFASWSEIVFTFEPTPQILGSALVFACVMGIVGGLLPAARAARVDVLAALRCAARCERSVLDGSSVGSRVHNALHIRRHQDTSERCIIVTARSISLSSKPAKPRRTNGCLFGSRKNACPVRK